jgi:hypothetical protein
MTMLPSSARAWSLSLLLLAAAPARAHSAGDEVTVAGNTGTTTNPSSWSITNRLSGVVDVKSVQLRGDFSYTHVGFLSSPAGANFASSPADVFLLQLSAEWQATRHLNLGIEGDYSPPSSSTADTPVQTTATVRGQTTEVTADGELSSRSSSAGGSVWVGYDTASSSRYQTYVDFWFTATEFMLDEQIVALWAKKLGMAEPVDSATSYCMTHRCSPSLLSALQMHPADLFQAKLSASVTETIGEHWDVRLGGAYYVYDQDPTKVGFFGVGAQGRVASRELQFGGGMPIAPWQFTVQPAVTARLRGFSATLSFQFGQYASDQDYSYDLTLGVRLQYKLGPHVKLWLKLSGQRDVDSTSAVSFGGAASLGAKISF